MVKHLRLLLLIIGLGVLANPLRAQFLKPVKMVTGSFFRLGIKGGVTMADIKTEGITVNNISGFVVDNINAKSGYIGGIYMRLGRKFFIEPELLASYKSGSFDVYKSLTTQRLQFDVKYTSLDIPIMMGYRLGPLHVMAGPVVSYSMTPNSSIAETLGLNLG